MARSITRHRHGIIHAILAATAVLCVAVAQHSAFACGLNWNEPQSHFQGVSFQGYVFQVERLGEVDVGDGLNLPLWAIFRSESNVSSPYVGQGWDIPLLESRIVQIDDIWFRMIEPTGWFRLFWRDEKDPTLIHGQGSWKGQIRGNTITTWASCGSKIVFNAGKITQLQVNGRTFDYQYSGNRVSEIREGGRLILKVNGEPSTGIVNGLSYGGQQMGIELGDRPQVQAIQGKNVVASLQKSLGKLTFPDGTTKEYEYAINEQLQPTLNISATQKRVIVWNPSSKVIVSDGDWTYDIKQSELPRSHAAIGRVNAKGLSEYWFYNPSKGEETIQGIDGVRRTRTWFVGGKLLGLTRSNVAELNGKVISENKLSRDETGRLIRDQVNTNSEEYFTGSYRERTYDANGRVKILRRTDGSISMFDYDKSGTTITTYLTNGKIVKHEKFANGMARRSSSTDDEVLETDSQGRPILHRTKSGINITYKYSEHPRVDEIFKDGKLACKVVYGADNISVDSTYFDDHGQELFTLDEKRNIVAKHNEHEQSADR